MTELVSCSARVCLTAARTEGAELSNLCKVRHIVFAKSTHRACESWKPLCASIDDDMPGKSDVLSGLRMMSMSVKSASLILQSSMNRNLEFKIEINTFLKDRFLDVRRPPC